MNALREFVLAGSGAIVGPPGVGKTFALKILSTQWANERPCLYLPIDRLAMASDSALKTELGIEIDFIDYLRTSKEPSHQTGILIIDAFDAARSDFAQAFVLSLVRRVVNKLPTEWNVIVSVRSYDARKSQELQDLFPRLAKQESMSQYSLEGIACRHFLIPELSDEEVTASLANAPAMVNVYSTGEPELRRLLRIPFNLWLLEKLVSTNSELSLLSSITSAVELLNLFWARRIVEGEHGDERRVVLSRAAEVMVEEKALSARRDEVYVTGTHQAWESLLSREVLTYTSQSEQRVAFFHNILFDYAVSVLLIEDDSDHLLEFVNADLSRPLFLRASLTYYFTRLWYASISVFWKIFWDLLEGAAVQTRLLARLIPIAVIVNEVRNSKQLDEVISRLKERSAVAPEAVLRLLQALRTFSNSKDDVWVQFFLELAEHSHAEFAWDLASYTNAIFDRAPANSSILQHCGHIGRKLLAWTWNRRETQPSQWLDSLAANQIIPLVTKTFGTNASASKNLLAKILELRDQPSFPIEFMYRMLYEISAVWVSDPEWVRDVYLCVFGHEETSQDKTNMGGYVLPLTSNRRQDWGMCHYQLVQAFPDFLRISPTIATETAIRAVDAFVRSEHLKAAADTEGRLYNFPFRGAQATYIPDFSYIWDQGHREEPIELADHTFRFFEDSGFGGKSVSVLLNSIRDHAAVAFWWKRILEFGSRNPSTFGRELFEMCVARPVQIHSETLHALGMFLEAAAAEFSKEQLAQIEESLLDLPKEEGTDEFRKALQYRRDRLLARIKPELLTTPSAKSLIEQLETTQAMPTNEPLVRFTSGASSYNEEDWLSEQGADLANPDAKRLLQMTAPLERFTSEWTNKLPSTDAISGVLPNAKDTFEFINTTQLSGPVLDSAWSKLASCVATISKGVTDAKSDEYDFCVTVLLQCATHRLPEPNEEYDGNYNFGSWSPLPRNEAAIGIPWLAVRAHNKELLDAIEKLCFDKVPSVRMLAVMELWRTIFIDPDYFFRVATNIAQGENNRIVQHELARSLRSVIFKNEEKVVEVLQTFIPKLTKAHEDPDSAMDDVAVSLITWLVLIRQNEWARTIIEEWLSHPRRNVKLLNRLTFEVTGYLTPEKFESDEDFTDRAISWLSRLVDAAAISVTEALSRSKQHDTDTASSELKDSYHLIDNLVSRLYFAADIEPKLRRAEKTALTDEQRQAFYFKIKPLLSTILERAKHKDGALLLAPTAHHFMELLNGVVEYDPEGVLALAALAATASEPFGYNLDPLAIKEVVELVEHILADHRSAVAKNEACLEDLLQLLDTFAKAGWPQALRLVWRLDEVFR